VLGNKGLNAEGEIGVVAGAVSPGKLGGFGVEVGEAEMSGNYSTGSVRALYSELLAFLSK
jgi:hypothetical protein